VTNPASETHLKALTIWDNSVMVFASAFGQFYCDRSTSHRLSGLGHLDNFIVTRKSCPFIGTLQKRMPSLTQTAANPNQLTVIAHSGTIRIN